MADPLIGIVMGSQSDWETMRAAAEVLGELDVPHEVRIVSAHRTPDRLFSYAEAAAGRGLMAIIAGAGGAAHLPGMLAAKTRLPVLGVPVGSKALSGLDSPPLHRADAQGRAGRDAGHRAGGGGQRRAAGGGDPGDTGCRPRCAARRLARGADRRRARGARWRLSRCRRAAASASWAAGSSDGCWRWRRRGWGCVAMSSSPRPTRAPARWPTW